MYHCLPLTVAGQLGRTVLNPAAFAAVWDGSPGVGGVRVNSKSRHVVSHFGFGILTINVWFHLRTSPDVDLLVKAVPNRPKDGATMLEGLIETDWFEGSFTVNLRLTRPGLIVVWDRDEALFQLVPYPRGWIERFRTEVVADGPEHAAFFAVASPWDARRVARATAQERGEEMPHDRQYRLGRRIDGRPAPPSHQRKLNVPPFPDLEPAPRTF
jgi:hypothetical protein